MTDLHDFTSGPNDGAFPGGSLALSDGIFYGMTKGGGSTNDGSLFRMAPDGTGYVVIHSFTGGLNDGDSPFGTPVVSGNAIYGVTTFGGSAASNGIVFKTNLDGSGFTIIHAFAGGANDGAVSVGSPVLSGNTLYCMTSQGGAGNVGTIFKVNTDGTGAVVLHSFSGGAGDGATPAYSALTVSGTSVYGMTVEGGISGQGTIFRMNADGTGFTVMHAFSSSGGDGWAPYGSLALYGNMLYGMTRKGGSTGLGTVFSIDTDGTGYNRLHNFAGGPADGANPLGSLLIGDQDIYGMTALGGASGLGAIFEMGLDGSGYSVLHSMGGAPGDGSNARGDLILADGLAYGMTANGGSADDGMIFSVSVPEPSSLLLLTAAGAAAWAAHRRWKKNSTRALPRNP